MKKNLTIYFNIILIPFSLFYADLSSQKCMYCNLEENSILKCSSAKHEISKVLKRKKAYMFKPLV